jgi:hypothetical protein
MPEEIKEQETTGTTSGTDEKTGRDKRLEICQTWHKFLDSQYRELKDIRRKSFLYRDADPSIVTVIEGRSQITTTDLQDAIDTAKPDILETIAGIDEPLKLDPDEARYVEPVKKLQVLGNVMVKRKNKWFRICSDFLDDSMLLKFGCIKYRWEISEEVITKIFEDLTDEQIIGLQLEKKAEIVKDETGEDGKRTTEIKYTVNDEYVRYDVVPSERIMFPLDTRDFAECPMVIEEVRLYEHEYRKMYGDDNFEKVKELKEACGKGKNEDFNQRFKHLGNVSVNHIFDEKGNRWKAYESYFWNKDKPWMMTWVGDIVFTDFDVENKYRKPPYRGGSPFLIAHSLIGKGYVDYLKNIQEEHTFLLRSINDVVSMNCHRRFFVDSAAGMDIDAYENNSATNAYIPCDSSQPLEQVIMPEPKQALTPEVLAFYELQQKEKDAHIPTPRAYGGLEGAKDERTYRGKQMKVSQASKKLLMMVRAYMEEVFGPLFQDTLDCIARFMTKKTTVRYLEQDYDIAPEEIICKYALIVNVGLGAHDKQDLIVKLQQLIGLAAQQMQLGIITPQNMHYMMSELVKAMGFLNTTDFVTDPKVKETVIKFVQMVQMMMEHIAQTDPETAQAVQPISQMAQQVLAMFGIQPEQQGGQNAKGTQTGETPARIQEQPANAMNPATEISGGNYFA